ncbi:putative Secretin family 7 transmembrane receptor [Trypoxylus dichotomus]
MNTDVKDTYGLKTWYPYVHVGMPAARRREGLHEFAVSKRSGIESKVCARSSSVSHFKRTRLLVLPHNLEVPLLYCNAVFDGILCWSPAVGGTTTNQTCPYSKKLNSSQVATRTCLNNGTWLSSRFSKNHSKGYTNYDNCVPEYGAALYKMCKEMIGCLDIVDRTRVIELVGLSLSMFSLVISLFIFYKYRILRNNRTKIHKNLFIATTIQVITRLLMYIDENLDMQIIGETEYLCEACIILLEYAKTAMFMWMFIEGLYLHNVITVTVFQEYSYVKLYFYIGWGVPLVMVMIWVFVMIFAVVTSG